MSWVRRGSAQTRGGLNATNSRGLVVDGSLLSPACWCAKRRRVIAILVELTSLESHDHLALLVFKPGACDLIDSLWSHKSQLRDAGAAGETPR